MTASDLPTFVQRHLKLFSKKLGCCICQYKQNIFFANTRNQILKFDYLLKHMFIWNLTAGTCLNNVLPAVFHHLFLHVLQHALNHVGA